MKRVANKQVRSCVETMETFTNTNGTITGTHHTLEDGTQLGLDDRVELDLYTANRSPDVFGEDAEVFNPYRSVAPGHEPFGLTFGTGVHTCLGRDLDGGFVPRGTVDPATHQYGIVAQLVRALLEAGAVPDPARPPERASYTARPNWGSYPVVFR
ncbi:MAG: hypothetical protein ACO3C6_01615 [Steroidobacteraceae bacterium]